MPSYAFSIFHSAGIGGPCCGKPCDHPTGMVQTPSSCALLRSAMVENRSTNSPHRDTSGYIWIHLDTSGYIWIYPSEMMLNGLTYVEMI
jgi:hypothetical protein